MLHESQTTAAHCLRNIEEFSLKQLPKVAYKMSLLSARGIKPAHKQYWTYLYELVIFYRATNVCDSRTHCAIETIKHLVSYHLLLLDDWIEEGDMSFEEVKSHTRELLNRQFDRLLIEVKGTYL